MIPVPVRFSDFRGNSASATLKAGIKREAGHLYANFRGNSASATLKLDGRADGAENGRDISEAMSPRPH